MRTAQLVIEAAVTGPMRHAPGRIALAAIAIALGVALGLSIYLINRAAASEISNAARSLYGLADLSVEASGDGFDEDLYPRIARTPGVAAVSPVVETAAKLVGARGAITLIGLDAFRARALQPALATPTHSAVSPLGRDVVYLSAQAARELGLARGEALRVQSGLDILELEIAGVLPPTVLRQRAGVVDIAYAQHRFGRLGRLSRIDVRLASGARAEDVKAALERLAPAHARITTPGEAGDDALRLSRAYRSNLTALALVALFTGGFFVYSTQALLTLKRRRELAVLHALGLTRGGQLASVIAGSVLIGLIGAVAGVVAGAAIARLGLATLGGDLGAGFFRGVAPAFSAKPQELAAFAALGVAVAVVAAMRPALEAARIPTASGLKAGDLSGDEGRTHRGWLALLLGASLAAVAMPPIGGLPLFGYAAIALLLIAAVVATPGLVRAIVRRGPHSGPAPTQVAFAQIAGAARYSTLSVAAIIVSFSLMTSMAIMVTSFRDSLDAWTQKLLPADLYVRAGYVGQSSHLEPRIVEALGRARGVSRTEHSRFAQGQLVVGGLLRDIVVIARPMNPQRAERTLWLMQDAHERTPADAVSIWINEAAADVLDWKPGDLRPIVLAGREVRTFVAGVWRDYEHSAGAVVMDHQEYAKLTRDFAVNTVWLWLESGASLADVQRAVRDILPPGAEYDVRTPGELRRLSLVAFDRTFAVTYLLELVAILIGLSGIAAGASAQVLSRRGELGALRHLGFTRAQIGGMLAVEGAVLGAIGVLVGLVAGGLVSLILIYVVNRQSFHWSMDLSAPLGLLMLLSAALVASSAAIAVLAGRRAMSGDVVSAVKEDW